MSLYPGDFSSKNPDSLDFYQVLEAGYFNVFEVGRAQNQGKLPDSLSKTSTTSLQIKGDGCI